MRDRIHKEIVVQFHMDESFTKSPVYVMEKLLEYIDVKYILYNINSYE